MACPLAPDCIVIESCRQAGMGSLHDRGCDLKGKDPSWGFGPPLIQPSSAALRILSRDLPHLCQGLPLSSGSCSWSLPELFCRCLCPALYPLILTQTCLVTTYMPDSLDSWQNLVTITGPTPSESCRTAPLSLRAQPCLPCCDFRLLPGFPLQNSLPLLLLEIVFLLVDSCILDAKTANQKYPAGGKVKCIYYKIIFFLSLFRYQLML